MQPVGRSMLQESMSEEEEAELLANGCVALLLIASTGDLIHPRNRCPGQVLTGSVDNYGYRSLNTCH